MNIPRQEALLILGLLVLIGVAAVIVRLLRARKHGISLRMQVFLAIASITGVICGAFAAVVLDRFEARAIVFVQRAALDDARLVAGLMVRTAEGLGVSLDAAADALSGTALADTDPLDLGGNTRVQIVDADERVLFDTTGPGAPPIDVGAPVDDPYGTRTVSYKGAATAAVPVVVQGAVVGSVYVSKPVLRMTELVTAMSPRVILLGLILAVSAALAGLLIGHSVAGPLMRLTRAAETVAAGAHQAPLPEPRGREARRLTSAFENMRAELEGHSSVESLAQDLSHELKNPVASVRAAAEVLEDLVTEDPVEARRFVDRIGESAQRIDALVRDLLSLARLEARGPIRVSEPFDLVEVVREAARSASRGVETAVSIEAPEELYARGDSVWIGRAVENLLTNAVRVSPEGEPVKVQISETDGVCRVVVRDRGPGVAEEIRDRLFDRFASSRAAEGGTGLGLSIVRAVAESHGGRAELVTTGKDGSTFAFSVPAD